MPTKKKSKNIMHLSIMRNFAIKKKKNCVVSPAHRVIEPNILFLKKKKKKQKKPNILL